MGKIFKTCYHRIMAGSRGVVVVEVVCAYRREKSFLAKEEDGFASTGDSPMTRTSALAASDQRRRASPPAIRRPSETPPPRGSHAARRRHRRSSFAALHRAQFDGTEDHANTSQQAPRSDPRAHHRRVRPAREVRGGRPRAERRRGPSPPRRHPPAHRRGQDPQSRHEDPGHPWPASAATSRTAPAMPTFPTSAASAAGTRPAGRPGRRPSQESSARPLAPAAPRTSPPARSESPPSSRWWCR